MSTAPRTETRVYAEHERLHLVKDKSQTIGEFLEWLTNDGVVLCREHKHRDECYEKGYRVCGLRLGDMWPDHEPIEKRLAAFFQIDLNKLDNEKREMLSDLRKAHASNEIDRELGL